MGDVIWTGNAKKVPQVTTAVPANVEVDDVFTLTINGKDYSYTAIDTSAATVATALYALLIATPQENELKELTFADDAAGTITITGPADGTPFTITGTATDGGGTDTQTLTVSTTTTATGPHHWDNADNWDTGAVPVNSDDVWFQDSDIDCLYGLDQSSVTLTSLNIRSSYTGKIGLPHQNPAGYVEYRDRYLEVSATTVLIGEGMGTGSSRIKLATGSNQTSLNVLNTSSPASASEASVEWYGNHASNAVYVVKGNVGIAIWPGETTTVSALRVAHAANKSGDAKVRVGIDATLSSSVEQTGGELTIEGGAVSVTLIDGLLVIRGSTGFSILNIRGGTCYYSSTGSLGVATVANDGILSFERDQRTKTVSNPINVYGQDAQLRDPGKVVSSLVVDLEQGAALSQLDLGSHISVTRGTPT